MFRPSTTLYTLAPFLLAASLLSLGAGFTPSARPAGPSPRPPASAAPAAAPTDEHRAPAVAAPAAHFPAAADGGSLDALEAQSFTLNLVLYAASTTANDAERTRLHPLLLGYEPNAQVEARLPWRRDVAQAVARWPQEAREAMLAFVLAHPVAVTHINALTLQMLGPAPGFQPARADLDDGVLDPPLTGLWNARGELAALMRRAWGPLGGAQLWATYAPRWRAWRIAPRDVVALRGRVAEFLGLPAHGRAPPAAVVHNPLMPADAAVTSVFADGRTWVVVGPTASPRQDDALLAHELAHPLVQTAVDGDRSLRAALAQSACAYAAVKARGESATLTRMVYTTWDSYFTEALIRGAIDDLFPGATAKERPLVLEPTLGAALTHAHHQGHTGAHALEELLDGPCRALCRGHRS